MGGIDLISKSDQVPAPAAARREDREAQAAKGRGVLDGAFALLEAVEQTGEAGLTRLASISGLPKATAHRLLEQLTMLGAVERHGGSYRMGLRVFRLGLAWEPFPGLHGAARRPMRQLASMFNAGIALTVPAEDKVVVVGAVGFRFDVVAVRPGMTVPMISAAGQAAAAHDPRLGQPAGYGTRAWRRARAHIIENGLATEEQEVLPGVSCAASPIITPAGDIAILSATVESARKLDQIGDALVRTARNITSGLSRLSAPSDPAPEFTRRLA